MDGLRVDRFPPGFEALVDEWIGAFSIHFGRDNYRLIWEFDDELQTIMVLAVERKKKYGQTIYQRPRPTWG